MAALPFNRTILINQQLIVQTLSGSATATNLFVAGDTDRFYRVKLEWCVRKDSDLTVSNAGGRHCTVQGGAGTAVIASQAAMYTAATSGATGTITFDQSGNTVRAAFTNDGAITGEIMYTLTVYT